MPELPSFLMPISGTLLNALTVLIGGTIGALIGDRLPERMHDSLFGALGLFTILIGLSNALATKNPLILLGALLIGTVIGEALNIDAGLRALGDFFQRRLKGMGSTVSEAFVTSSLVFCVGPLTILGSLDNGLVGDPTKLVIKSTLDGFAALAFGATLGWGVLLSVFTILTLSGRDQPCRRYAGAGPGQRLGGAHRTDRDRWADPDRDWAAAAQDSRAAHGELPASAGRRAAAGGRGRSVADVREWDARLAVPLTHQRLLANQRLDGRPAQMIICGAHVRYACRSIEPKH